MMEHRGHENTILDRVFKCIQKGLYVYIQTGESGASSVLLKELVQHEWQGVSLLGSEHLLAPFEKWQEIHLLGLSLDKDSPSLSVPKLLALHPWFVIVYAPLLSFKIHDDFIMNGYSYVTITNGHRIYLSNKKIDLEFLFHHLQRDEEVSLIKESLEKNIDSKKNTEKIISNYEEKVHFLESHIRQLTAENQKQSDQLMHFNHLIHVYYNDLQTIYKSRSWKLTIPLRYFITKIRFLKTCFHQIRKEFKVLINTSLKKVFMLISSSPKIKTYAMVLLKFFPSIKQTKMFNVCRLPDHLLVSTSSEINVSEKEKILKSNKMVRKVFHELETYVGRS